MTAGARRCTPEEAYELAYRMRMDRMVEQAPECDAGGREYTQVFHNLDELVDYLERPQEDPPKKRWWEFWKRC
jgi:hypothetical protein